MKKEKNWDYIAKLEKLIAQKYGDETVKNPKSEWTKEKEQDYLEQIKKSSKKHNQTKDKVDKVKVHGFLVSKKLVNRDNKRECLTCEEYSFDIRDDLYMLKFECCYKCYIQYVENREERWLKGWRPFETENKKSLKTQGEKGCHKKH